MFVGDDGRISQIVTNLLGNAIKFTERGHVIVDVTGWPVTDEAGSTPETYRLHFAVEDTGPGIPQEKLSTVFDKFSQIDMSTTRQHEGTGLGLAISSSLVNLMGGEVGADSTEGEGSTFWFAIELPVHVSAGRQKPVPFDSSGVRALIVDDNEVNRSILKELMDAWGFECVLAASGNQALTNLKATLDRGQRIDFIILDYQMPEMHGGDVLRAIRADRNAANIPVIMLTSVEETADGNAFSALDVEGHLTKPARSSLLHEKIIQILQDNRKPKKDTFGDHLATNARYPHGPAMDETIRRFEETRFPASDPAPHQPAQSPTATIWDETIGSGVDVILCEDNKTNQMVFQLILKTAGYSYKTAANGREGVSLYQMHKPKLILMDVSMPEMNGLDAAAAIRKLESGDGCHTPIIGVSAHALEGDMEICMDAGMDDYLSKPTSPEMLIAKIEKWIALGRSAKSA